MNYSDQKEEIAQLKALLAKKAIIQNGTVL